MSFPTSIIRFSYGLSIL